jgi:uncharacterized tellurite resistance protein B-like protein
MKQNNLALGSAYDHWHRRDSVDYGDGYGVRQLIDADAEADARDQRFLVASLLIFVAKGDGNISSSESGRMLDLLTSHLKLTNAEALDSLTLVVNALQDDADIARKLRALAGRLSTRQKLELLAMMLDVAAVDDVRDDGETEAMNMASRVLELPQDAIRDTFRRQRAAH